MTYRDELIKAMSMLAENPNTIFLGQAVASTGTAIYHTLKHIPIEKRLEIPICEELQLGMSTGLALKGFIPISIYPRWNFLILAANQIINHLDTFEEMSDGQFKPKIIIRTCKGSVHPLMPGPQHSSDFHDAFNLMCKNINMVRLENSAQIVSEYQKALSADRSTILTEIPDRYDLE